MADCGERLQLGWRLGKLAAWLIVWIVWAWLAVVWIGNANSLQGSLGSWHNQVPSLTESLHCWSDDKPLCVGDHALHWYQFRAMPPWRLLAWDPLVYGGYLQTPWWNARGRLASLWLLGGSNWATYKLGLLLTLLVMPLLWWQAAVWWCGEFGPAWLSMLATVWLFWSGPGPAWLAAGELDLVAASGLAPVIVAGWCAWQSEAGFAVPVIATLALAACLWVYPLAGVVLVLFGIIWYLRVGARQSAYWHLLTLTLNVPVVVLHWPMLRALVATWWLLDFQLPDRPGWWHNFLAHATLQDGVSLATLLAGVFLGCWRCAANRSAGRTWLLAVSVLLLAGFCPALPIPEAWQPNRLAYALGPLLLPPSASVVFALRNARLLQHRASEADAAPPSASPTPPSKLGLAVALVAGIGILAAASTGRAWFVDQAGPTAAPGSRYMHSDVVPDTSVPLELLLGWLTEETTLDARIAVEEGPDWWSWAPVLIARSGRVFLNGLARETPRAQLVWRWRSLVQEEAMTSRWTLMHLRDNKETRLPTALDHRTKSQGARPAEYEPAAIQAGASWLGGKWLREWSAAELTEWFDRWNVGWLLVRQETTAELVARLPATRLVRYDRATGWRLFAREFPGYFVRGQGRLIRAQPGELTWADLQPEGQRCLLRLAYVPGLVTSLDQCRVGAASENADHWPQVRCLLTGPQARLTIRFEETAYFLGK